MTFSFGSTWIRIPLHVNPASASISQLAQVPTGFGARTTDCHKCNITSRGAMQSCSFPQGLSFRRHTSLLHTEVPMQQRKHTKKNPQRLLLLPLSHKQEKQKKTQSAERGALAHRSVSGLRRGEPTEQYAEERDPAVLFTDCSPPPIHFASGSH